MQLYISYIPSNEAMNSVFTVTGSQAVSYVRSIRPQVPVKIIKYACFKIQPGLGSKEKTMR